MIKHRQQLIHNILITENLDAILIFGLANIRYLCGFTGSDGVLLLRTNDSVFLTDSRYQEQAQKQVIGARVCCYRDKLKSVSEELCHCVGGQVGFDADEVSVSLYDNLSESLGSSFDLIALSRQLKPLRGIKSEEELESLRKAANLNLQAFDEVFPLIKPGVSEREISLELEFSLKRHGGEATAFDFIVASGHRGALPHGIASEKKLTFGELVTIDFGTRVNGYHSDETVTFALGTIDRKLRQIFDIVLEAHDSALKAVRPGLKICELDAVARDYIESTGFGGYFGHGLGHGVGLDVHEYPAVSANSDQILATGMVITIEPGIYIPDSGGVRIEDTIVVTEDGFEALTSIPKQFRQIN